MPVFLQNVISLRTSSIATACGVVTITAPSHLIVLKHSRQQNYNLVFNNFIFYLCCLKTMELHLGSVNSNNWTSHLSTAHMKDREQWKSQ